MWPQSTTSIVQRLGILHPIVQAPMAGSAFSEVAIAVANAGGLGSLACPLLDHAQIRSEVAAIRAAAPDKPFNLNFFAHRAPPSNAAREDAWKKALHRFYVELGIEASAAAGAAGGRAPFDEALCALVEEIAPKIVSFHFGLPDEALVLRVKKTGAIVLSSATTVAEARWLEDHGCDVIIAQGAEAGGHRGMFLGEPNAASVATQVGTFALVPQIVDAVRLPVIAAGGIADARGIVAALTLGASAVQIGTAYLFTPEARVPAPYREGLLGARDDSTVLTNIFTGRPARGIANRFVHEMGAMSELAPAFPNAGPTVLPLRNAALARGSTDFYSLWAGQSARLAPRDLGAAALTNKLSSEAFALLAG